MDLTITLDQGGGFSSETKSIFISEDSCYVNFKCLFHGAAEWRVYFNISSAELDGLYNELIKNKVYKIKQKKKHHSKGYTSAWRGNWLTIKYNNVSIEKIETNNYKITKKWKKNYDTILNIIDSLASQKLDKLKKEIKIVLDTSITKFKDVSIDFHPYFFHTKEQEEHTPYFSALLFTVKQPVIIKYDYHELVSEITIDPTSRQVTLFIENNQLKYKKE